jgi:hypothetical protein
MGFNKYNDSKIYAIFCKETNDVYIGSTCKSIFDRIQLHIADSIKLTGGTTSKQIICRNNYSFMLLEHVNCETNKDLISKEMEYIKKYKNDKSFNCVNKAVKRTDEEIKEYNKQRKHIYYENNKDKISEYNKKTYCKENAQLYRDLNKQKIAIQKKEYNNRPEIKARREEKSKENKENNLEYKKKYQKLYQINNKERIQEQRALKITCECGCVVIKRKLEIHKQTNKHNRLMCQ